MIAGRYLQVSHIELRRADGCYYADELWHRDIVGHLSHVECLVLLCPCGAGAPSDGWRRLDAANLTVVELPSGRSLVSELFGLPWKLAAVWREVGLADIVHSGVAGWPMPTAWLAVPIARLRRRFTVVVVESAPWLVAGRSGSTWRGHVRSWVYERLARFCVSRCDLPIFTHEGYRKRYLGSGRGGRVIPASWISREWVLDAAAVSKRWRERHLDTRATLRLGFYGRLVQEKGIVFLLEALRQLEADDVGVELDIWGKGPLDDACSKTLSALPRGICARLRGVLPYGAEFRSSIGAYDAVVIPSLSDEQPRIIYDAFAQGVPCLASDTVGHRQSIASNETGILVPVGDKDAWIGAIRWCVANRSKLAEMGSQALVAAQMLTHEAMHAEREQIVAEKLLGSRNAAAT